MRPRGCRGARRPGNAGRPAKPTVSPGDRSRIRRSRPRSTRRRRELVERAGSTAPATGEGRRTEANGHSPEGFMVDELELLSLVAMAGEACTSLNVLVVDLRQTDVTLTNMRPSEAQD